MKKQAEIIIAAKLGTIIEYPKTRSIVLLLTHDPIQDKVIKII